MEETRVPVYLITGFLESGKTSFLSFTLQQDYFQIDGKTLLILCEEGEEEYDEEALKQCNTVVESIDSEEELTPERLAAMEILHQPERVIIEYNGMWLAPVIDILPEDYGIWFVDSMDHPDRYVGKTVHFKARVLKPRGMGSKFFVPGRTAMTCCADDTTFLGYICKSAFAPKIAEGQWVDVTAKVAFEKRMEYQGEGIVLYAEHVEVCEPLADEMVYFN